MKKWKVLATLLLATVTIGGSTVVSSAAPLFYKEEWRENAQATRKWAQSAIHWALADGISVGDGNGIFGQDSRITRAEAVTMLTKFKEISAADYKKDSEEFTDVNGAWYTPYVNAAYENGYIAGKGNGLFDPKGTLTRAEAVSMIVKAMGYKPAEESAATFEDIADAWYTGFIQTAYDNGIVSGKSASVFDPNGKVTRAEFVMMLYKASMRDRDVSKNQYTAIMIPADEASFSLVKDGEEIFSYNAADRTVNGAEKVKTFDDSLMVYFTPVDSFEMIPADGEMLSEMRVFANGFEVLVGMEMASKAVFSADRSVTVYRSGTEEYYPMMCLIAQAGSEVETACSEKLAVSEDLEEGQVTNGFKVQTALPLQRYVLTQEICDSVKFTMQDKSVSMEVNVNFKNGATMIASLPEEDTYFLNYSAGSGSKLWVGEECYFVDLQENFYYKEKLFYSLDYDADGQKEYLLVTDDKFGVREWYLIDPQEDHTATLTKVHKESCLSFGDKKEIYVIDTGREAIFCDGEKVYPVDTSNTYFNLIGLDDYYLTRDTDAAQYTDLLVKDLDGDGKDEYAITYVISDLSYEQKPVKEALYVIDIGDNNAKMYRCPEGSSEEMAEMEQRIVDLGYTRYEELDMMFEIRDGKLFYYIQVWNNYTDQSYYTGELTFHEDGTFGFDEKTEGSIVEEIDY